MAQPTPSNNSSKPDILEDTQRHARRLRETLQKYATDLAAARELDPEVREQGLAIVRRAAECARRLMDHSI